MRFHPRRATLIILLGLFVVVACSSLPFTSKPRTLHVFKPENNDTELNENGEEDGFSCYAGRVFTEEHNGLVVDLRQGDMFAVDLKELSGTGYTWQIDQMGSHIQTQDNSDFGLQPEIIGGVTARFCFVAHSSGASELILTHRPDNGDFTKPVETFQATFKISP